MLALVADADGERYWRGASPRSDCSARERTAGRQSAFSFKLSLLAPSGLVSIACAHAFYRVTTRGTGM